MVKQDRRVPPGCPHGHEAISTQRGSSAGVYVSTVGLSKCMRRGQPEDQSERPRSLAGAPAAYGSAFHFSAKWKASGWTPRGKKAPLRKLLLASS